MASEKEFHEFEYLFMFGSEPAATPNQVTDLQHRVVKYTCKLEAHLLRFIYLVPTIQTHIVVLWHRYNRLWWTPGTPNSILLEEIKLTSMSRLNRMKVLISSMHEDSS